MLRAFALAFGQLFSGPILTILGACTILSVACFFLVWLGIDWAVATWIQPDESSSGWWSWLSGLGTIVLTWLLFPVVATAFVSLFLNRVAGLVEERHYPDLPPAKDLPLIPSLLVAIRFVAVFIAANLVLLFLLFFPPVYVAAWLVINGWLLGREYFELVAMRRLNVGDTDSLRKRNGIAVLITGIALTGLLVLPPIPLILPVLATAVMVHRFHELNAARS